MDRVSDATRTEALTAMSGWNVHVNRDSDVARQYAHQALEIFRHLGDKRNAAWTTFWLETGSIELISDANEYTRAMVNTEEAIAALKQEEDLAGAAQRLNNLGDYAYDHGEYDRANAAYQRAIEVARQIHDELREHMLYIS